MYEKRKSDWRRRKKKWKVAFNFINMKWGHMPCISAQYPGRLRNDKNGPWTIRFLNMPELDVFFLPIICVATAQNGYKRNFGCGPGVDQELLECVFNSLVCVPTSLTSSFVSTSSSSSSKAKRKFSISISRFVFFHFFCLSFFHFSRSLHSLSGWKCCALCLFFSLISISHFTFLIAFVFHIQIQTLHKQNSIVQCTQF